MITIARNKINGKIWESVDRNVGGVHCSSSPSQIEKDPRPLLQRSESAAWNKDSIASALLLGTIFMALSIQRLQITL